MFRLYFEKSLPLRSRKMFNAYVENLSVGLRREIALRTYAEWLEKVPYFKNDPEHFLAELAMRCSSEMFAPQDPISMDALRCKHNARVENTAPGATRPVGCVTSAAPVLALLP